MNIKNKTLFFLAIIGFVSSCCKKDTPPPTYYVPQELKDWMYYKQGSYWVYQDSASNINDSVYVTSSEIKIEDDVDKMGKIIWKEETFYVYTQSTLSSYIYIDRSSITSSPQNCDNTCYIIYRERKTSIGSNVGTTFILFLSPKIGLQAAPNGLTYVTLAAIYDSLQVGGKYFHNVVRMDETKNETEGGGPTKFYIAKHYGIIRKEITAGNTEKTWNLVNYKIVQ